MVGAVPRRSSAPGCRSVVAVPPTQIDEGREIAGLWWLPSNPAHRVAGVLGRGPAGNGVLRLENVLMEPEPSNRIPSDPTQTPLIVGETGSGPHGVTLIDCYESHRWNAEGWTPGPKSQSFTARYSLVSLGSADQDDPTKPEGHDPLIARVWTRLDVLDAWGHRGHFASHGELEQHDDGGYSSALTLHWPADLVGSTPVGSIRLTTPPIPFGSTRFPSRVDVSRHCYLDCELEPAVPLSDLFERVLSPLRTFFAVATDSQAGFTQLSVTLAAGGDSSELWLAAAPFDADGNARLMTEQEAEDAVRQGFFTIRHIESTFGETIGRWFEMFDRLETPITSVLAAGDYRSARLTSDHFQSAAFAAEALHRSLGLVVDSVPPDQRIDIARRLLAALTAEERQIDWIRSRTQTVANPRYEDRISQLLERSPVALQQAAGGDFARRVKRARNYFAHLDDRTLRRPSNDELHRLTSLLVLLMVSQLLNELGLDDVGSRVRYADRFWELQRRHLVSGTKMTDGAEVFSAHPAGDQ